jgi:hypothetical protein
MIGPLQRPDNIQHKRQTSIPPAGYEPEIPPSERRQTHALDRAATRICQHCFYKKNNILTTITVTASSVIVNVETPDKARGALIREYYVNTVT